MFVVIGFLGNQKDTPFLSSGWFIQDKEKMSLNAALGVAVRYYLTQEGKETDYTEEMDAIINELNDTLAA